CSSDTTSSTFIF
nr:immunoglobulin light chain junction region [Macaca mulatta]